MPDKIVKSRSEINYSYATIKITQSRIDKGLIAIPMSLAKWFPDQNARIQVFFDDALSAETKQYSSYKSRTKECRIGGMGEWLTKNGIEDGDEIVIQLIDKERLVYRLTPESKFLLRTREIQNSFDRSETEICATEQIQRLSRWACVDHANAVANEYIRLVNASPARARRYVARRSKQAKESSPCNLRLLLRDIYGGHCQVCDFWFLKKDNEPYFEIHHINPLLSNNPKNLVVVCANCHRQFEYAHVAHEFSHDNWLVRVGFNKKMWHINQFMLTGKGQEFVKRLHVY